MAPCGRYPPRAASRGGKRPAVAAVVDGNGGAGARPTLKEPCMKPRKTFTLFAFLALTVWCGTLFEPTSAAGPAAPIYEIAFSSLGPINADVAIADADGSHAKPLLPHAGFDGNASFSSDGQWVVFTSERDGSYDIYRAHPDASGLERLVDHPAYRRPGSAVARWTVAGICFHAHGTSGHLDSGSGDEEAAQSHQPAGEGTFGRRGRQMDSGWRSHRIGIHGNRSSAVFLSSTRPRFI